MFEGIEQVVSLLLEIGLRGERSVVVLHLLELRTIEGVALPDGGVLLEDARLQDSHEDVHQFVRESQEQVVAFPSVSPLEDLEVQPHHVGRCL